LEQLVTDVSELQCGIDCKDPKLVSDIALDPVYLNSRNENWMCPGSKAYVVNFGDDTVSVMYYK